MPPLLPIEKVALGDARRPVPLTLAALLWQANWLASNDSFKCEQSKLATSRRVSSPTDTLLFLFASERNARGLRKLAAAAAGAQILFAVHSLCLRLAAANRSTFRLEFAFSAADGV